jgi:hypothetical protein
MNTNVAVTAISTLLTAATNAILAAQRFQALVEAARTEGRDISDDELAALKLESEGLTQQTLDLLDDL